MKIRLTFTNSTEGLAPNSVRVAVDFIPLYPDPAYSEVLEHFIRIFTSQNPDITLYQQSIFRYFDIRGEMPLADFMARVNAAIQDPDFRQVSNACLPRLGESILVVESEELGPGFGTLKEVLDIWRDARMAHEAAVNARFREEAEAVNARFREEVRAIYDQWAAGLHQAQQEPALGLEDCKGKIVSFDVSARQADAIERRNENTVARAPTKAPPTLDNAALKAAASFLPGAHGTPGVAAGAASFGFETEGIESPVLLGPINLEARIAVAVYWDGTNYRFEITEASVEDIADGHNRGAIRYFGDIYGAIHTPGKTMVNARVRAFGIFDNLAAFEKFLKEDATLTELNPSSPRRGVGNQHR